MIDTEPVKCTHCATEFIPVKCRKKFCSSECSHKHEGRPYDAEYIAKRREANRLRGYNPKHRKRVRELGDRNRAEMRRWLDAYKLSVGCAMCGYRQHAVSLEFDHISGIKTKQVSACYNLAEAKHEMTKCQVLCSNCHQWITHQRRPNKLAL